MIKEIVTHPDDRLREKSKDVSLGEITTEKFSQLVKDMTETMKKKDGIGLAAPQIGVGKRVAVINSKNGVIIFVNPKVVRKSFLKDIDEECCLSVPGKYGKVKRCRKITVRFDDGQGQKNTIVARGLFARVIQHELDHLDGILFIDKLVKSKK